MKLLSFLRRGQKAAPALALKEAQPKPRLPDNLQRIAEVLAIFGEEGIQCRAFGTRGVFLPTVAAVEVARRLQQLAEIESRGYL